MPNKSVPKKKKCIRNLKKELLYLCSCCSLIILLFLASFNIESFLSRAQVLGAQTQKGSTLVGQARYWEDFLSKNPTYLDGWLELAQIEYELGNTNYALGALNSARAINPNSPKVKKLGNLLLKGN
jgi:cytochrome c-type biogenesis protein CcmH/NrfG